MFAEVAKQNNFTQAAKQLCVTQPAVSRQIKALEKNVGVKLFQIVDRELLITNAGENLIQCFHRIENDLNNVMINFRDEV